METLISHPVEELERVVSNWQEVSVEPHRFGGKEFRFNENEIGHIHFDGMLDIPFTKSIRDILIGKHLVKKHYYLPETGWISYPVKNNPASLKRAQQLLRLSYLFRANRKGVKLPELSDELNALNFGTEINSLFR